MTAALYLATKEMERSMWALPGLDSVRIWTDDHGWDEMPDYTDSIGEPSSWMTKKQLAKLAAGIGLAKAEATRFASDPEGFLANRIDPSDPDGTKWWEHPVVQQALDEAWRDFVYAIQGAARKRMQIRYAYERGHGPRAAGVEPEQLELALDEAA